MDIHVRAVKTGIFCRGNDLNDFLEKNLGSLSLEGKVLAVTSKIVSIAENRLVPFSAGTKKELIKKEADTYLCEGSFGVELTIKHGILIPSAGIDESNSESGDYIIYPSNPYQSALALGSFLKKKFHLKDFGIILTDSHSTPLRKGVIGISLAHWGFVPTSSLVGQPDLFNKPLQFTSVDIADSLAAVAVLAMGEANECTPLALISSPKIVFNETSSEHDIRIEPEKDLYFPLLSPYLKK
jgi:F420-0:gamma-glutamyl ligase